MFMILYSHKNYSASGANSKLVLVVVKKIKLHMCYASSPSLWIKSQYSNEQKTTYEETLLRVMVTFGKEREDGLSVGHCP